MELAGARNGAIYPQPRRLKTEIRQLLSESIFGGFKLELDKKGPQKRLTLQGHGTQIPFMVWSAGQREFVPLLLGLYWLLPSTNHKRSGSIEWVMIEELEMGLHPKAIAAMFFVVLELLWRGYRVCLSTHSPQILELVWALRMLQEQKSPPQSVLSLFGVKTTPSTVKLARAALNKVAKVYYFDPKSGTSRDISNLDPAASDVGEWGWGGLTEISGRIADIVADATSGQFPQ